MPRGTKKGYFVHESVTRQINRAHNTDSKKPIRVMSRASTIPPEAIGLRFQVHNGMWNNKLFEVTAEHVGFKFGDFVETKKPGRHGGVKKAGKK